MKAAKTWCVASILVLAAFSSASCGKDEASGGNSGGSGMIVGGSAGSSGNLGRGGTGGSGGGVTGGNKLGRACISDTDCADTSAPGLTCITAKDTVLGDGAPPKGLCTAECTSDDECGELSPGSLCVPFQDGAESGYCVEGCEFGKPELGEPKCHNRPEFACTFAGAIPTGDPCTDTVEDCQPGEFCSEGECLLVVPACLPQCRGDIDCEAGYHCDQGFLRGVCVEGEAEGKGLGEPCTVVGDGITEPDECLGFCQADEEGGTSGHCTATCAVGRECSWNTATEKYDGACVYLSVITREIGSTGDFGFCAPTCNCSEECNDPTLSCYLLGNEPLLPVFRGPGLCFTPDPEDPTPEYNQCEGAGGAGGAASGGAGGGAGEPSAGGAPTGEGGAGGGG